MLGVDLSTYRFDYDLTFCSLLMNADGTTYHIYGGRDWKDPQSHLSLASLIQVLEDTLADHAAYQGTRKKSKRRVVEDLPPMKRRIESGQKMDCVHCHTVHDMQREHAREQKRFKRADIWIYPNLEQAGFSVSRDDQTLVTDVIAKSAAAKGGLQKGDRLTHVGAKRVRTFGDIQQHLHDAPAKGATLKLTWERDGKPASGTLRLPTRWKEQTPEVFAWRPSKWPLSPKPGFGGRPLSSDEKTKRGLAADGFAFKVGYIVTWGPNRHTGHNAHRAGIRKNDIVYSVCGQTDFADMHHFHSWFRLTRKIGSTCEVLVLRGDKKITVRLPVIE